MSVTKRVFNNGIATIIQRIIRVLDQLFLVPFFLVAWGSEYYGEWLTLSIIPSVLAFSDLGLGSAVSNSFVLAYASGNKQSAANICKSGFWIVTISILLGVLITGVVLFAGSRFHLFEKSLIDANEAMTAVTLLMASRLLGFYNQIVEGFFRGARKAALGSFLHSGNGILNVVVGFIVLSAGCGVVGYALSHLIISLIYVVLYFFIGRRLVDLRGYSGQVLKSDLRTLISKGMGYMMTPIWQSIYFQGGTFVVRLALGAESVAVFNTVRTVCRSVNQMYSIVNGSIFPELQYEYGQGNMSVVHRLFRVSVVISMIIGLLGMIVLMVFGIYIYNIWTHNVLIVPTGVWDIFMLGIFFNAIWWTSVVTYRMTNQPYHFAIASTIVSVVSVGMSYALSVYWGLVGAVIGAVIFDIVMAGIVLPDSCKMLGMKVKDLFVNVPEDFLLVKEKIQKKVK